jgi:hypothetical protein
MPHIFKQSQVRKRKRPTNNFNKLSWPIIVETEPPKLPLY